MAKFEYSEYVKLWKSNEGRLILSTILTNPDLIKANHMFWKLKFRVDPQLTPTDAQGRSTFISEMREPVQGALMSMRAPMSHNAPEERGALKYYTGTIPSFSPKQFVENASERMYKEELFEQFGDAVLIAEYATNVLQPKIDSANQTLSHMAAQLLSTGKIIVNFGEGIKGNVLKADIPAENFLGAGSAVWTDTSFPLLSHLRDQVEKLNAKYGEMAWQLEITRNKFNNTFMKNTEVINWVKLQYSVKNGLMSTSDIPEAVVTSDSIVEAVAKFPYCPAIVIIDEKQNDVNLGTVSGWTEKYAVLRPVGYAGYIRHSKVIEKSVYDKYGSKNIIRAYSYAVDNLLMIINSDLDNGELREWHTEAIMNAIPSLDEFLYHYIIDTTDAVTPAL